MAHVPQDSPVVFSPLPTSLLCSGQARDICTCYRAGLELCLTHTKYMWISLEYFFFPVSLDKRWFIRGVIIIDF